MEKILFVCSGNTCRSPMAEGLFNMKAAEKGLPAWSKSAGVSAMPGMPASGNAVRAAAKRGADISRHTAAPVTEDLLEECAVALCMTSAHAAILKNTFPKYAEKIRLLSKNDVSDPFGGGMAEYDRAADEIEKAVELLCEAIRD